MTRMDLALSDAVGDQQARRLPLLCHRGRPVRWCARRSAGWQGSVSAAAQPARRDERPRATRYGRAVGDSRCLARVSRAPARPDLRGRCATSSPPSRLGLSAKLLLLTLLFVMLAEVLIFVPSIANFRINWLTDRLTAAQLASLAAEGVRRTACVPPKAAHRAAAHGPGQAPSPSSATTSGGWCCRPTCDVGDRCHYDLGMMRPADLATSSAAVSA